VSNQSCAFFEGCLSVQGYRGLVRRYLQVRVRGYGGDGKPVDFVAKGWQARIAQHEMDHLDGVLYVDRMDSRTFRRVDLLEQPLPGAHPELGPAPVVGKCADFAGPRAGGGAGGEGGMAVEDVEGFIGKKKSKAGRRKSR
jgi:peptide deformylase